MATKANLLMDAASDFSATLTLIDQNGDPLNLTGFNATSAMRRWYTSSNAISFNVSINVNSGTITLELDASISADLYPGKYVYDVDLNNGVTTSRIVEGEIFLNPAVTANTILTSN
jgi:hypothetical protein